MKECLARSVTGGRELPPRVVRHVRLLISRSRASTRKEPAPKGRRRKARPLLTRPLGASLRLLLGNVEALCGVALSRCGAWSARQDGGVEQWHEASSYPARRAASTDYRHTQVMRSFESEPAEPYAESPSIASGVSARPSAPASRASLSQSRVIRERPPATCKESSASCSWLPSASPCPLRSSSAYPRSCPARARRGAEKVPDLAGGAPGSRAQRAAPPPPASRIGPHGTPHGAPGTKTPGRLLRA